MRIAAYYPWVYLRSGVERTILELCKRSRHEYTVFTNRFEPEATYPEFKDMNVVVLPDVPVRRDIVSVLRAAVTIAAQKLILDEYQALMIHSEGLGDLALNRATALPAVCFCHTPLRPVFDPAYRMRASARRQGMSQRLMFHLFSAAYRNVDQRMWARYEHVFFNSEESRRRAESGGLLGRVRGGHEILHPGIDWSALQPTWTYERYFLVAGRIMWTKNVELAIAAFARFKQLSPNHADFRLVIAGQVDDKSKEYVEGLRRAASLVGEVEFVISPSDEVLHQLYKNCYAVLFTPFNEDWGIVPLEANAFGKAVIAPAVGGPLESQRNAETGLLVPLDADAFAEAMAVLAVDGAVARRLGETARAHARQWDWSYFVARADDLLETIVEREEHPVPSLAGHSRF